MGELLSIVAPIFLIVGAGFGARKAGLIRDEAVDGLLAFVVRFAVTSLLFRATAKLEVGETLRPGLLAAYYGTAVLAFALAILVARRVFKHRPGVSVAAGFDVLFGNSLFIGLPVVSRALGPEATPLAIGIVSIHAPAMYAIGIVCMEASARDGAGPIRALGKVARSLARNSLVLAVAAGFAWNATGLAIPGALDEALALMAQVALPCGMFGIGASLARYGMAGEATEAGVLAAMKIVLHPLLAWGAALALGLDPLATQVVVLMAAVPAGMNVYFFAVLYRRGEELAASVLLLGTAAAVISLPLWIALVR